MKVIMNFFLKKRKNLIALFLILSFFSLSAVISTNYYSEQSHVRSNEVYFDKYKSEIGLTEKSRIHREFNGGYAGDAIHYIMIAMGKEDLSHTPYTYRVLVPKTAGIIAKQLVDKKSDTYQDDLFKRTSFIWRGINLISCFLLILIPLIHFQKYIFTTKVPFEFPLILLMNVFNMGVIMTAPFSLVDIPTFVIITLGASFFFNRKIKLLALTACIGIFVKEITLILMLPILVLAFLNYKKNFFQSILCLIIPFVIFIIFRNFISGDAADMGQMRYSLSDPLNFYYLKRHIYEAGLLNFFGRVFFSIGIVSIIFILYRVWFKKYKLEFLVILALILAIIILNLLLASAVIRVSQVVTPFIVFYILETIRANHLKKKL